MSDYHYGPEDPLRRDDTYDPGGGSAWGWVAAAVFVVVVLGLLFAMNHQPGVQRSIRSELLCRHAAKDLPGHNGSRTS